MGNLNMTRCERDALVTKLLSYYPGDSWRDKVSRMSESQLVAISERLAMKPPVIKGYANSLRMSEPPPKWSNKPHYYCDICGVDYLADNPYETECRCCCSRLRSDIYCGVEQK